MPRHHFVIVATVLLAVCSRLPAQSTRSGGGQASRSDQTSSRKSDAELIIEQARASLGGSTTLDSVTTLEILGTEEREYAGALPKGATGYDSPAEPFGFKMRWPDRFQFTRHWFIHTLEGRAFWQKQTGGPTVPQTPDLQATARRSTELNAATCTLAFLLKTPPSLGLRPRYLGVVKIEGLEGPTVEFVGPTTYAPKLIFDPVGHTPMAAITTARRFDASGIERVVQVVKRLEDYRKVDGLRFPFRLDERAPGRHTITRIKSIRVNPPLGLRDFANPSR